MNFDFALSALKSVCLWLGVVLLVPSDVCYKARAIFLPSGHPIYLPRHFSTLPHSDGSDYLQLEKKKKRPRLFQEIISFLIPLLESVQLHPSFLVNLEARAKLSSILGP